MIADFQTEDGKPQVPAANELCDLLLEVAGRDTNRLPGVRRHVRVLDAALPHMSAAQAKIARERIRRHQTKWGPLLEGNQCKGSNSSEICEISPEQRVADWLATRKVPERLLIILYRAANCVWSGETSISRVMEHSYANETDLVAALVGYDSFKEWLLQLRIAHAQSKGIYRPGSLCGWWVENMKSTDHTSYAACMELLMQRPTAVG